MRVQCTKCGETATTKCHIARSVFPTDQIAAVLSYTVWLNEEETELRIKTPEDQDSVIDLLEYLIEQKEHLLHAICDHHWETMEDVDDCQFCRGSHRVGI